MKVFKFIVPLICMMSLVTLEVIRDTRFFYEIDSADMAVLDGMAEEELTEKEGRGSGSNFFELDDLDFQERCQVSFIRESIYNEVMNAHDLLYNLLEQKVLLPPPEFKLS